MPGGSPSPKGAPGGTRHPSSPQGAAPTGPVLAIGAICGEGTVAPAAQPKPLPQGPPARGAPTSFVLGCPKGCARHRDSFYHVWDPEKPGTSTTGGTGPPTGRGCRQSVGCQRCPHGGGRAVTAEPICPQQGWHDLVLAGRAGPGGRMWHRSGLKLGGGCLPPRGHVVRVEEVASHPGRPTVVRGVSREHKETGSRFLLGALVPPGMWGRVASEVVNKGLGPCPPPPQGTGMAGMRRRGQGDLPQQSQPTPPASTLIAPRSWRRARPHPAVPRAASGPARTACEGGRRHRAASRPATLLPA